MFARSTTVQGNPQALDQLISYIRDDVMPVVQAMPGYVGNSILCDRENGTLIATTAWDTEEAMRASETVIGPGRGRGAEMVGGSPTVQEWDVVGMHRTRPTPDGACARLIWARGQAGQLDRVIDAWRTTVPSQVEQMPGFCSVSALVDRASLRAVSAVAFESREAMERSADQGLAIRDRFAATMQFEITDVEEYDIVLAHLRIPEMV